MSKTCRRVTIFEGPDGSGKSTAAAKYAEATGARLVHCGPLPRVTARGLGRYYLEAMAPALDGYEDVVLDRCWISEPIYGRAFRGGLDRLGRAGRRLLERVAMRCDARVVLCLPPWETCHANWQARRALGGELLDQEEQYQQVFAQYAPKAAQYRLTELPTYHYDYTAGQPLSIYSSPMSLHDVDAPTAGHLGAKVLLVGDEPSAPTDYDWLRQYPLCGLHPGGCSRWLAATLHEAFVAESQLLWTNANAPRARQVVEAFRATRAGVRIALGDVAARQLKQWDVPAEVVPHPQYWKRFCRGKAYPLVSLLKEVLQ